jgi:CcmD family protein
MRIMSDTGYVVGAFAVVWIGLFIYIFVLVQRERALRKEIAALKEGMKKA